ncbi:hypothetical protein [Myxococcus sp. RHSTA-1-4]|uniref:hypothetical protein n=1 Tax=Myxococcus sp. RHSTA-1-4 TaxID=2874601 RepID=UPI001CC02378|nr:hypothetical protein [Myxococcus sp. RHSTA-1-4]MBZ4416218.1 hypothetical protein [Myxococcus sp. RHSTA-1-4]
MFNPADIQRDMVVRDRDGERLGAITTVDAGGFFIEKGPYFTREYRVAFSDVMDLDGDDVYLRASLSDLPGINVGSVASPERPMRHDLTGGLEPEEVG